MSLLTIHRDMKAMAPLTHLLLVLIGIAALSSTSFFALKSWADIDCHSPDDGYPIRLGPTLRLSPAVHEARKATAQPDNCSHEENRAPICLLGSTAVEKVGSCISRAQKDWRQTAMLKALSADPAAVELPGCGQLPGAPCRSAARSGSSPSSGKMDDRTHGGADSLSAGPAPPRRSLYRTTGWSRPTPDEMERMKVERGYAYTEEELHQMNLTVRVNVSPCEPLFVIMDTFLMWERYISPQFYSLMLQLPMSYNWWIYNPSDGVWPTSWLEWQEDVTRQLGRLPDVLYFLEGYYFFNNWGSPPTAWRTSAGIARAGYPAMFFFANDLHSWSDEQHAERVKAMSSVDLILSPYSYVLDAIIPEVKHVKRVVLSHAAAPHFQIELAAQPIARVLISGALAEGYYRYRSQLVELAKKDQRLAYLSHPRSDVPHQVNADISVGVGYACTLNSFLVGITDGPVNNYAIAKIVEIPSTGALLLLNSEMEDIVRTELGMLPYVHYIPYSLDSLDRVLDMVLDPSNAPLVRTIREQGQQLVWSRHLVYHRAAQIHWIALREFQDRRPRHCSAGAG